MVSYRVCVSEGVGGGRGAHLWTLSTTARLGTPRSSGLALLDCRLPAGPTPPRRGRERKSAGEESGRVYRQEELDGCASSYPRKLGGHIVTAATMKRVRRSSEGEADDDADKHTRVLFNTNR